MEILVFFVGLKEFILFWLEGSGVFRMIGFIYFIVVVIVLNVGLF